MQILNARTATGWLPSSVLKGGIGAAYRGGLSRDFDITLKIRKSVALGRLRAVGEESGEGDNRARR